MQTIIINDKKYYSVDEIIKNAPIYAKGVKSSRELITKKNIPSSKYIFAKYDDEDEEWTKTDGTSKKFDKVFISKFYIDEIDKLKNEIHGSSDVTDDDGIEKAPEIIDLEDHEKFHDDDGNALDIETRGEREPTKIYFKVKDISIEFEINTLHDNILKKERGYIANTHYKFFNCQKADNVCKKEIKKVKK